MRPAACPAPDPVRSPPPPPPPPNNTCTVPTQQVDRDFTDQDYQLLLRLDELEGGGPPQEPPPPLPEDQLALLPVHVHRSPPKKALSAAGKGVLGATPSGTPPCSV